jgi:GH15 family glucan-1,4-alpha-glucosidase
MPLRIEDYALIGDSETAALVGRDGSIDWLCWPRFDSDACFAALLGTPEHGRWLISPADAGRTANQRHYRGDTLILETRFETKDGAMRLVDFMPPRRSDAATNASHSTLVRLVIGERGRVALRTELVVRFGYGSVVPWVHRQKDGTLRAIAGPDQLVLRTAVPIRGEGMKTVGEFTVAAGEATPFTLTYAPSNLPAPDPMDPLAALERTEVFWREWSDRARIDEDERRAVVIRSLITLKALTHAPTGGIVAAPTTLLARDTRWHTQLGLPFLLVARCHAIAAGADERRILRGSRKLARLALAGSRGNADTGSDYVRRWRRAPLN